MKLSEGATGEGKPTRSRARLSKGIIVAVGMVLVESLTYYASHRRRSTKARPRPRPSGTGATSIEGPVMDSAARSREVLTSTNSRDDPERGETPAPAFRPRTPLVAAIFVSVFVVLAESVTYYSLIHHQSGAFSDLLGRAANFKSLKYGGNIYAHFDFEAFTYPPGAILLLCPLVLVPLRWLAATWTIATLGALWAALAIVTRRLVTSSDARALLIAAAVTAISPLAFPSVYDTVFWGQIATFLTLAVVADFLLVHGPLQGVLVGLATTLKVYPGVFIVLWLVRRQYRQALTAIATVVLTTLVATGLWYSSSYSFFKDKLLGNQEIGHLSNGFEAQASSSIPALFLRPPYFFGHFTTAQAIAVAAVVALLGIAASYGAALRGHELTALTIGLVISIICSPVAWNHYFAFVPLLLFLPFEIGWRSWTARAALFACAVNAWPWHRWKLAGANQVLLTHHQLYLSYVAQNATLVSMLLIVLVGAWEFWPPALSLVSRSRHPSLAPTELTRVA